MRLVSLLSALIIVGDHHSRASKDFKRRLPQAIIIGVPKAGTTALIRFLDHHPDVAAAHGEPDFFTDHYHRGLKYYVSRMPKSTRHQITIEKSPGYFNKHDAIHRMKAMNDSLRLIVVVRDPVERLVSAFKYLKVIGEVKKRMAFEQWIKHATRQHGAVDMGRYARHLRKWTKAFGDEQIYVVDGQRFAADPFPELHAIESFLGLRHFFKREMFIYEEEKGFFCFVRKNGRDDCLDETKGIPHPPVNETLIAELRQFYAPLNRDFFEFLGREFGWD